jgi:hypothetical protein
MTQFHLLRGSSVEAKAVSTGSGKDRKVLAEIEIDGKFQHRFTPQSRVSKHLEIMTPKDLSARLSGGSFFFIDEEDGEGPKMVDFRDGQYHGFIHTDESVGKFMEVLGFTHRNTIPLHRRKRNASEDVTDVVLRREWSNGEIEVPGYQSGGQFNSRLSFVWNPYVKTINSTFDLVRLICTNGAVGLTSFLNTKIPLQNRWEEHLDIASRQIQNKVSSIVVERVQRMIEERASVGECLLLEQHIFDRLYSPTPKSDNERERLLALLSAVSPQAHMSQVYREEVFLNKALAAQVQGHLSHFDLWNIATEVRTHTGSSANSSDNALDKLANSLMFDVEDNYSLSNARMSAPSLSSFADPERAFYGTLN